MVDTYVEVVVLDLEKDWVLIEGNKYHSVYDTQHYMFKKGSKYFLESWYVYHHLNALKTISIP